MIRYELQRHDTENNIWEAEPLGDTDFDTYEDAEKIMDDWHDNSGISYEIMRIVEVETSEEEEW